MILITHKLMYVVSLQVTLEGGYLFFNVMILMIAFFVFFSYMLY